MVVQSMVSDKRCYVVLHLIIYPDTKCFSNQKRYLKKIKSVLNTITCYLEDDKNDEVNFIEETSTFTLQMIKI